MSEIGLSDYEIRYLLVKLGLDKTANIVSSVKKINDLKSVLERYDMNRENGKYPKDWDKYIDEIASIVWRSEKS